MAKRVRALGIGQKNKKAKVDKVDENKNEASPQIQLTVEGDEDPEDEIVQLKTLWKSYLHSDRESDALLNGIANECDALLSNNDKSKDEIKDPEFYAVFALALSELTIFNEKKVKEFFDNATEIVGLGLREGSSDLLNLVKSKIIFQRIPLEFISKLKPDSIQETKGSSIAQMLTYGKNSFKIVQSDPELTFEVLKMFDDLLDIVENFGHAEEIEEGLDSDDEDDEDEIALAETHPLHEIQVSLAANYEWLKNNLTTLHTSIEDKESKLFHAISKTIGELYLKDAEGPSATFMELQYRDDDDAEELSAADAETAKKAQKEALDLTKKALEYLEAAQISDEPETWVQVAEAYIDLGNLHDYDSTEQEDSYKKAEQLLRKANTASHNKYADILDNLLQKD